MMLFNKCRRRHKKPIRNQECGSLWGAERRYSLRGDRVEVLVLVVMFYFLAWLVVTWRLFAV